MPAFEFEGQTFQSPVELALHAIGGSGRRRGRALSAADGSRKRSS